MPDVGKAYVQIVPSGKGVKGELEKMFGDPADGAGKKAGEKAGASLMAGLGKIVKAAAVGKIIKDAFTAGSDLEQNLGGTAAVFGDFAQQVQNTAAEAYKNMGLSASDYMATANKMGSLFQGSGLEQSKAFDLTAQAMQRASDVASVMGIDISMAMESIAGAAKGNFTMMDNLGVAMNATTIEAYALEKGLNFKWNVASNAEKAEVAMQMFFERTSQYAGNFEREVNDTVAGSLSALQASWKDLLGALTTGYNLDSALGNLTKSLLSFAKNAAGMGKNVAVAIGRGLLEGVPVLMQNATNLLNSIGATIRARLPELVSQGGEILRNIVNGIITNLPSLIAAAGSAMSALLDAIATSLPSLIATGTQLLVSLAGGLLQAVPALLNAILTALDSLSVTIVKNFPQILQRGIELVGELVKGIFIGIPSLLATVPEIFDKFKSKFSDVDWPSIGRNLVEGIKNGVLNAAKSIADAAAKVVRDAVNAAKEEGDINSPSGVMEREVGRWMPAGMANGIEKWTPKAEASMRASVDDTIMSAQSGLQSLSAPAPALTAGDLRSAMNGVQMAAPVVKIIGDTSRIFKVVNDTNQVRTRATNYNALAMG